MPPEDAATEAAAPCTPLSDASAATLVTGSPSWDCYENKCSQSLSACAKDCQCNNDVLTALNCVAMDAGSATTCFGPVQQSQNAADMLVISCLVTNSACMSADGGPVVGGDAGDAGPTEAGPAPSDAGDGGG